MKKRLFAIFLILLVFNVSLIISKTKLECSCSLLPPGEFSPCCCNCPYCVEKRGGFLCACNCHERTEKPLGDIPLIGRAICHCGYHSDFDLPGVKYPVLAPENLFSLPTLKTGHFPEIHSTLSSQVYLIPPDHPT
jgi:hypothetical protein